MHEEAFVLRMIVSVFLYFCLQGISESVWTCSNLEKPPVVGKFHYLFRIFL